MYKNHQLILERFFEKIVEFDLFIYLYSYMLVKGLKLHITDNFD